MNDHRASNNPNWKGGIKIHGTGRVMIYCPEHPRAINGRYRWRSHVVMEEILGRLLTKSERVHHKNGIKTDDSPENLELLSSESEHTKLHVQSKTGAWAPEVQSRLKAVRSSFPRGSNGQFISG